jgi:insulysin
VLVLFWILPYVEKKFESAPLNYFSHLFGHEGENSLLSYLISEGLALELSAGGDHELWTISTFRLEIVLTKKGLENYEKVIEACFQYAQKLKEAGPQEWVFKELQDLGTMQFEF